MRKSEWSDKQLEDILREMPVIIDHRDPRDIYQNILPKAKKRNQRAWLIPGLAAAAAMILFFILAPGLINWQESAGTDQKQQSASDKIMEMADKKQQADTSTVKQENAKQDQSVELKAEPNKNNENDELAYKADDNANFPLTAVYEEDMQGKEVLTYAIPDQNALVTIPVSVVVPKNKEKTKFEQFAETMPRLTEEEWGLLDYYPMKANLSYDSSTKVINVDVPDANQYVNGSASEEEFKNALGITLNSFDVEKITLTTDGKPGILLGNTGNKDEIPIKKTESRAYYMFYPAKDQNTPFLVPVTDNKVSIQTALNAMKTEIDTKGLKPSIPPQLKIDNAEADHSTLIVFINKDSKLENTPEMVHSFEAILMTAKDFGYQAVKFKNAPIPKLGPFSLDNEIKVPVAPNKRSIGTK